MRQVTLVGPHRDEQGILHQKGETIPMSDTDAEWYTNAVLEGRRRDLDQPMVAALVETTMPADHTAQPGVETSINSDQRDLSRAGAATELQTQSRTESPVAPRVEQTAEAARTSVEDRDQRDLQDQAGNA